MLPQSTVGVQSLTYLHARVWAVIYESQFSRRRGPRTVKKPSCLNPTCSLHGNVASSRDHSPTVATMARRSIVAHRGRGIRAPTPQAVADIQHS